MATLDQISISNDFVLGLPSDSEEGSRIRSVDAAYSLVRPTPVGAPEVVGVWPEVMDLLGIDRAEAETSRFAETFAGNRLIDGIKPYAMAYGGHQFGNWAGQLGDGRAIAVGEVENEGRAWTLQLKGAGPTPFSRSADGRAVLRSSIREFLCSEAVFHLGIPTTRALSLVLTGDRVMRDMFYDGHPELEPGAVVCRVSESFVRFGSFELPASRRNDDLLRRLADFTIERHYPGRKGRDGEYDYAGFFDDVMRRTVALVVEWDRVGFVHGVLNTDNMSILGETIDYGPYGWLDNYDPGWTPNTTDAQNRRYRFGNQAGIGQWNLIRLANALFPLVGEAEPFQESIETYVDLYSTGFESMMMAKLGLEEWGRPPILIDELIELLGLIETDFTNFFRGLADFSPGERRPGFLLDALYGGNESLDATTAQRWGTWFDQYSGALSGESRGAEARRAAMNRTNPKYVLRNYLAQNAIDAASSGDFSELRRLQSLLRRPYDEQEGMGQYAAKRPDWARDRAGCSQLSCSS